jgi:hypothetical protein
MPRDKTPEPPSMEALHREVADMFEKTAEYLGRGKYNEQEHIALLERLEFYSSISSIHPEQKKAAQDFIKDMNRLLTLKESVARQVKLAEQISEVVTDAQVHLAKGERNEAVARKLMDRIEGLYAISGLSEIQNKQLRTSLGSLRSAYKTINKSTVSAPASSRRADTPRALKPSAPKVTSKVASKTKPKPVQKVPVATVPKKARQPASQIITIKFQKVMKYVSRYLVVKKYNQRQHDKLTADLLEVEKNSDSLNKIDQKRLSQIIEKMKRIDMMYKSKASTK